jgi:hypothetical protein
LDIVQAHVPRAGIVDAERHPVRKLALQREAPEMRICLANVEVDVAQTCFR